MITLVDELIVYYQNLLIIQYKTLAKASANIAALAKEVIADLIYTQVQNAFDLTTAIGAQLDTLGAYVGAFRFLANFSSLNGYFALPLYANPGAGAVVGFSEYTDLTDPVGYWKLYTTIDVSLSMSDGQLQSLTQYLIALHACDMSVSSIDLILQQFFGQYLTLTDNLDMTITYTHLSTDPFELFSIVQYMNAFPKPAGVGISIVVI